ncbi:barstar family protein [Actinoplanes sp. NPDC023714]|uniref:barstar family protein n=1 Tax=Actinoplanes sp. NPDC023714 TaxID=3154322 RepID=UPI0033C5BE5F
MIGLPWLLVDETIDDGDNVVAACADIDGLFVPVTEPPLERYTLLDCRPAGRLRAACDDTGPLWVGNIGLEAVSSPDLDQELLDVSVLEARRSSRHGPVELTVSARTRAGKRWDKSGYRLTGLEDFGVCGGVAGPEDRETLPRPATLLGCRPGTRLQRAIDATSRNRRWVHASIFTVADDGTATRLLDAGLGAEVAAVRPSLIGDGLVDVEFRPTYADAVGPPRPLGARDVWQRWRQGRPTEPGSWAGYDRELRQEWAGAALAHHTPAGSPQTTVHLDGRHITDEEGFYCAVGEAVNGPGGYFGWNLGALHDCLLGGWGAEPGFRLIWHDSAVAVAALKPGYDRRWWAPALTMDQLLGLLAADGVDVELL